jgi:Concanavalin A-like lectin/glucanases superfamily
MSTNLLFLVPIGTLAVVWSLCFVGCVFQTSGLPGPPYSNVILKETSLLAYWPLNDGMGQPPTPPPQGSTSIGSAADLSGNGHVGSYLIPPVYPTNPPAGSAGSMQIPGTPVINLDQSSIVPGDVSNSDFTDTVDAACVDLEGGYVSIPWSTPKPIALPQFTFEAWIKPNPNLAGFEGVVFSALLNNAGFTGFQVLINAMNQLVVFIGDGTPTFPPQPTLTTAIDPTDITYIAVTCDISGNFTLFANGLDQDTPATPQMFANTGYVPVDPTQQVTYFIGAGENADPLRTQDGATGAPEFPFLGLIQSVALYSTALATTDLQAHFSAGSPG